MTAVDVALGGDDDVGVDDGLRGEAGYGRRADVLDAQRDLGDRGPHERRDPLEGRPATSVVVGDDDGLGHAASLSREASGVRASYRRPSAAATSLIAAASAELSAASPSLCAAATFAQRARTKAR